MNRNFKARQSLPHSLKSPLARQFKSPLRTNKTTSKAADTLKDVASEVQSLRVKLIETRSEIGELEKKGFKESELQDHIDKLHEYNEIKDIGVMVLGKIAQLQGVQSKDLYEKYGLDLND